MFCTATRAANQIRPEESNKPRPQRAIDVLKLVIASRKEKLANFVKFNFTL